LTQPYNDYTSPKDARESWIDESNRNALTRLGRYMWASSTGQMN